MILDQEKNTSIEVLLKEELKKPLPGFEAHRKMLPLTRVGNYNIDHENARKGAVLIIIYNKNDRLMICFIKRSNDGSVHSGQIGLPGGRHEKSDKDLTDTALRETEEEIGLYANQINILGILSTLYIPVSNYSVLPVIGFYRTNPEFKLNTLEVEELIEVPISTLINPIICKNADVEAKNKMYNVPVYDIGKHKIWGATAMIISEFIEIYKSIEG